MRELTKSIFRRASDSRFINRYFVGTGIDIGGAPDPLSLYSDFFPLMMSIKIWDLPDGDAQLMESISDESFDFVHSSHCLEHLNDPYEGIRNWFRILKPNGHLIVTIPEEDLYEQGIFPSTYNRDHKWTFTIHKFDSWSTNSVNVIELLISLGALADIKLISLEDRMYRYSLPRYDQTSTPITESAIEFIVRKKTEEEIEKQGRLPGIRQPASDLRKFYNQYQIDYRTMKDSNFSSSPFLDEGEL